MSYISNAMGWVLAQLSTLFNNNFAASVFVFTVAVNLLLLPLTFKTQKSTAKQAKLKPKIDSLKKKYGDDRQKLSQATNELYQKEGVSMSGGCLPMIIRLLIMMGVYWAVVSPFTYVQQLDKNAIDAAKKWSAYVKVAQSEDVDWTPFDIETVKTDAEVVAAAEKYGDTENIEFYAKLDTVHKVDEMESAEKDSPEEKVKAKIKSSQITREVEIANFIVKSGKADSNYQPVVKDKFIENGGNVEDLEKTNFSLFGIDLTRSPDFSWNFSEFDIYWIIPILSFVTAMLTSVVSMVIQKKTNPGAPNMMAMMLIMPLFSLYIAFQVPGAVGFYWACSNLISGGLQSATQIIYGPAVVAAKDQSKNIAARDKLERERIKAVAVRSEN